MAEAHEVEHDGDKYGSGVAVSATDTWGQDKHQATSTTGGVAFRYQAKALYMRCCVVVRDARCGMRCCVC